jgi:chromate transport protein ChrA
MKSSIQKHPSLRELFISFLKLGLTAFGGPAMIAYIRKMAVDHHKWLDGETFKDGVVLCQSIPGATAMQAVAYVGMKVRGVPGALLSFIGFSLPAFAFMLVLTSLYDSFHTIPRIVSLFSGLQVLVCAIVANAAWSFGRVTFTFPRRLSFTCPPGQPGFRWSRRKNPGVDGGLSCIPIQIFSPTVFLVLLYCHDLPLTFFCGQGVRTKEMVTLRDWGRVSVVSAKPGKGAAS